MGAPATPHTSHTFSSQQNMSVIFYYDVVCPFAYTASKIIESVIHRAGATVHWTPVLLGKLAQMML